MNTSDDTGLDPLQTWAVASLHHAHLSPSTSPRETPLGRLATEGNDAVLLDKHLVEMASAIPLTMDFLRAHLIEAYLIVEGSL